MMSLRRLLFSFLYHINGVIPKDNCQILFYSAPDFSDNPYALYKYLIDNRGENKFVWLVDKYDCISDISDINTRVYLRKSIRGMYAFFRSRTVVFTHQLFPGVANQKKQIVVNVWHGEPIKKVGYIADSSAKIIPNHYSIMCVTSDLYRKIMSECMKTDLDRNVVVGLPRNDLMFAKSKAIEEFFLHERHNKVILWMPTFRKAKIGYDDGDEGDLGLPVINQGNIRALDAFLKENGCLLIVKIHPLSASSFCVSDLTNIIEYSDIPNIRNNDLYYLIGKCDALITDYSSVYIDYLNMNRPIGFVFDDFDNYNSKRGFIFEDIQNYMPGPIIQDYESLLTYVANVANNEDGYSEKRASVNKLFNKYSDNKNCERLWGCITSLSGYNKR